MAFSVTLVFMKSINKAILGYSGFVGSNLCRQVEYDGLFNRSNAGDLASFDFIGDLTVAAMPAEKWRANAAPREDLLSLQSVISAIPADRVGRLTLISTVDVYEAVETGPDEECDRFTTEPYGQHRRLLEEFVQENFKEFLIVRLPALFGKGLKKNILYDLMKGNQLENVRSDSSFQWYDLSRLSLDIERIALKKIDVCNISPSPLSTKALVTTFFPDLLNAIDNEKVGRNYDVRSVHSFVWGRSGGYSMSKDEVLNGMSNYIRNP